MMRRLLSSRKAINPYLLILIVLILVVFLSYLLFEPSIYGVSWGGSSDYDEFGIGLKVVFPKICYRYIVIDEAFIEFSSERFTVKDKWVGLHEPIVNKREHPYPNAVAEIIGFKLKDNIEYNNEVNLSFLIEKNSDRSKSVQRKDLNCRLNLSYRILGIPKRFTYDIKR